MKKKLFFAFFVLMIVCFVTNVRAVDLVGCEDIIEDAVIDVKIPNAVHLIITVIKVVVPVLLVVFGMLDLGKAAIAQKEDEIKKGQQIFIKRLITAAIIFFVVSIVQLVISVVSDDEEGNIWNCVSCFLNGADKQTGTCND